MMLGYLRQHEPNHPNNKQIYNENLNPTRIVMKSTQTKIFQDVIGSSHLLTFLSSSDLIVVIKRTLDN